MGPKFALAAGFLAGTALLLVEGDNGDVKNEFAGIFPHALHMPSVTLDKLTGEGESDNILRDQISSLITEWLRKNNDSMISVSRGDIVLSKRFPDQDFSPSDSRRIQATDINAKGALLRSTVLGASAEVTAGSGSAQLEVNSITV